MSESQIRERLSADLKEAMRAKDKDKLSVIRLIQGEIKKREIDDRDLIVNDAVIIGILFDMVKMRRQSIKQFLVAERPELAAAEELEITIIQNYLPPKMDDNELKPLVKDAIATLGASSMRDMSKIIAHLQDKVHGRVESDHLSALIKEQLTA
jgi:uncharacterized protein YqeY